MMRKVTIIKKSEIKINEKVKLIRCYKLEKISQ